jgi:predicted HTH transcriptional regulator
MPVRVFIFDDRVEIHSPGNLPAGMTVESVVSGMSMPRNDLLFNNAAFLLPYTGAGSGLKRAMDTGIDVQFNDNEKTKEFVVTIPRKEHHVNAPSSGETHHENAPSNTEVHHESAPSEKKCTIKTHQLTKKQLDIVNFCSVPRTSKEIMDRLGLYNQSRNRQRHIQPLIDMGFLEMTVPENPKAKGQKYRKTMQS